MFQRHGPQLDDAVPPKLDARGLRIEDHDAVKLFPKLFHQLLSSARRLSPVR